MTEGISNPFNVTKAVDFSDQEINDYWVDMPSGAGFVSFAKPTSPMPMLILGGKGSGKTHLMRYFSYPLQKIRYGKAVLEGIKTDGYIGIYLRCSGLNATRFREKGQSPETWADVFAYYMELWLGQLVVTTALDVLGTTEEFQSREAQVATDVMELIRGVSLSEHPTNLHGVCKLLREKQFELDSAVDNASLAGNLPVRVSVTRGDLVFGIPRILSRLLPMFRKCLFVYLMDEFENLLEMQQKYVNTLLRERQSPCSFKIGARLYGIRTHSTYSADEENKEGSEFETLRLDSVLRGNKKYGEFARRLIAKRLAEFDRIKSSKVTLVQMSKSLDSCFEEPGKSDLATEETAYVVSKYKDRERPYFEELEEHLKVGQKFGLAPGVHGANDIQRILELLRRPELPLLEKTNLFFFYQDWRSSENLVVTAQAISRDCDRFVSQRRKAGRYKEGLLHFKADLLAQLYRETDQRQKYVGLTSFIEISSGIPRNLLVLLKNIFAWASFNGEQPFHGSPISMDSQQAGVLEASEWFYQDARLMGADLKSVMGSVQRLGTLFRGIRFSKKPAECSCSTFSGDVTSISETGQKILDLTEKWSLIVNVGTQRDRNTERIDAKYQLNPMLAPRWDLSIYRRGALALTTIELESIFDPEQLSRFSEVAKRRIERMTPPFFGRRAKGARVNPSDPPPSLFNNLEND